MFSFLFGGGKPLRGEFSNSVRGEVVDVHRAQYFEEKCGGFDVEILVVACDRSGDEKQCAVFSEQSIYGAATKGQRVEVDYARVLDADDFGTALKAQNVRVLSF